MCTTRAELQLSFFFPQISTNIRGGFLKPLSRLKCPEQTRGDFGVGEEEEEEEGIGYG